LTNNGYKYQRGKKKCEKKFIVVLLEQHIESKIYAVAYNFDTNNK